MSYSHIRGFICLVLLLSATTAEAQKALVLPPFENFSPYKSSTYYDLIVANPEKPEEKKAVKIKIDQYAETARAYFEDRLINQFRAKVVDRERFDQEANEMKYNKSVNPRYALVVGKKIGAKILIMGSILGFEVKEETINAYGLNQKIITSECSIRIRAIEIETGEVVFSKSHHASETTTSSSGVRTTNKDGLFSLLKKAVNTFPASKELINIVQKG